MKVRHAMVVLLTLLLTPLVAVGVAAYLVYQATMMGWNFAEAAADWLVHDAPE